ncbi:MAG: efflux RND transporter permease subunit, partial [Gammaproteobacteria bacterium]|nr:efflux RND transporter permease subunit [Gammaproteobacteria bacterium]
MQKRFTDVFINRPVFSTCISLIILLVGFVSYTKMDIRQYPKVDASVVEVLLTYPGANSEVMEGFVATPVEQAIASVDGIDYMTSSSVQNQTTIAVNLKLGYDINVAMTDIANEVQSVMNELPDDLQPPVIEKNDPNQFPVLWYNVHSDNMDAKALTDYLIRVVQPQIQPLQGVSQAFIYGEREYAMRVWLDPFLMAAKNVTPGEIYTTINSKNVIAPAGNLKSPEQQITLYASTDLQATKAFNDMIVRNDDGHLVRIKDVGQAVLGASDTDMDYSVYVNGKQSMVMAISPKPNANSLDVANAVNSVIPSIRKKLPQGVKIDDFYDQTRYIRVSLKEVQKTIFEACIFVFLVIFLMLGSLRAVIVPLVTIPLSLTGACIIMLALHFSINTLTLLAFVLAIGLVVDDAIVVLENIHRHLEEGLTAKQAALVGGREIAFAIVAMTLTLAAVYLPIGFMPGLTGQLFTEFALTLAGAVLVSGFIALTLSPMMCSKIYKSGAN